MTQPLSPSPQSSPSPLFLYLFRLWKKRRMVLILVPLISMVLMALYALFGMKVWYKATVTAFPPSTGEGGGLAGLLGGLAPGFPGLELTKLGAKEGIYSPLVLLQSRRMIDTLIDLYHLADVYELPDSPRVKLRKYVASDIDVSFEREGNYVISVYHTDPIVAADMANRMVEIANKFASELFQREYRWQIDFLEQRLATIERSLAAARDSLVQFAQQYQIVEPETQVKTAIESIADLRAEITKYQIQLELLRQAYGPNDPAVQAQEKILQDLQSRLVRMETQPGYFGNFPLQKGASVALRYMELLTNVETYYRIKAFLIPMLEETKVKAQRFKRILNVLDPAVPPDMKARPKRSLYVLGTGVATFLLLLMGFIAHERYQFYRKSMQKSNSSGHPVAQS